MAKIDKFAMENFKARKEFVAASNKLFAALNSGAFVAYLYFVSHAGHRIESTLYDLWITPLESFAAGLTAIILTAYCNYIIIMSNGPMTVTLKVIDTGALIFGIFSVICFLYGIWVIAIIM